MYSRNYHICKSDNNTNNLRTNIRNKGVNVFSTREEMKR